MSNKVTNKICNRYWELLDQVSLCSQKDAIHVIQIDGMSPDEMIEKIDNGEIVLVDLDEYLRGNSNKLRS